MSAKFATSVGRILTVGLLAAALGACTPQFRTHGYAPSDTELKELIVGVDTRASVEDTFGPATTGGVGPRDGMYYVETQWRDYGWRAPQPLSRQVVVVSFDTDDVISNIERFTLQDGRVVPLSRRVTDSPVQNRTLLRQILGSIGRFDAGQILGDDS